MTTMPSTGQVQPNLSHGEAESTLFREFFRISPDAIVLLDNKDRVLKMNPAFVELFGYPEEEAVGRPINDLIVDPENQEEASEYSRRALDSQTVQGETLRHNKSGEPLHVEIFGRPLMIGERQTGIYAMYRNVTDRWNQEQALAYQATHDALTGLKNRFQFEKTVNRLREEAIHKSRTHTFLYMDLDQFKVVNDTCGHNAGDELLRQISAQIDDVVCKEDLLARLGGDEFGLLLADCNTERGREIAEKIICRVNKFQFEWESQSFEVGVSIGLVVIDGRLDYTDLLKAADQACYLAKDQGRNRYHIYHDEDVLLRQRSAELRAAADVRTAMLEQRFDLHAQRIVPLGDTEPGQCHELLLRMRDRDGKLIPPGQFIRGSERYNRMPALDRWVVEEALSRIGRLCAARRLSAGDWFSINLSGASVNDREFGEFVCAQMNRLAVDPAYVCFEITESSAITHHRNAVQFLKTVRSLGCRVMLDDFGSGLSSFAYLKTLPLDFIKLDGSLIRDIARSEFNQAIVRAVHDVARVLELPLIAEHVETEAELELLRSIGVEYAQGYLLHLPEPWEEQE